MVFGLDIGTRNVVGTVGYKESDHKFVVVAQAIKAHETRAMLDGQIHDINKVALTISQIKKELEQTVTGKLTDVCIAAAGRVLKTITIQASYEFPVETVVNSEHIRSLDLLGVEKAYETIREETKDNINNFYCVGYSVVRYFLNDISITNLEGHKANQIGTELIATFLPDDVIDGLYASVERADLQVANLTLEPIAAINVAIPEKFRLLNIALLDVGAGTSDICITKDGSIKAYGMIPYAGDEITEVIMHRYLVEFNTAEKIKLACLKKKTVSFKDIMGISHKIDTEEVKQLLDDVVCSITEKIATRIIELNGDKSVSAVFVVGGGGKIPGFTGHLANHLNLLPERVALRGEEVLKEIEFAQKGIKKDPLLVTPIGICLNYYDQKNNFIFVSVNGERIKLYDNNKLTIVDAAIQIGFPNNRLFPRRGEEIQFTINQTTRVVRGELGEAAIIKLNGKEASINTAIAQNDIIEIIESTMGKAAEYEIRQLPEFHSFITFQFNGQEIICPRFAMVNGNLVSEFYRIQNNDEIVILNYYTVAQLLQFMDLEYNDKILVNHEKAALETKVYENFSIEYELDSYHSNMTDYKTENTLDEIEKLVGSETTPDKKDAIEVIVNGELVELTGKENYIFVDILDFYPFDLSVAKGSELVLTLNGEQVDFTRPINAYDKVNMYWKE